MSQYRKAIAAASAALLVTINAFADGSANTDEIKAIGAAWVAALVVFLIPNEAAGD